MRAGAIPKNWPSSGQATLFVVGIALFLGVRTLLVPDDYGLLGPYRVGTAASALPTQSVSMPPFASYEHLLRLS